MESDILISTLENIPNYTISETKGIISRVDYYSNALFKNLKEDAKKKGCNAIINCKLLKNNESILAYGEGVILEKK